MNIYLKIRHFQHFRLLLFLIKLNIYHVAFIRVLINKSTDEYRFINIASNRINVYIFINQISIYYSNAVEIALVDMTCHNIAIYKSKLTLNLLQLNLKKHILESWPCSSVRSL